MTVRGACLTVALVAAAAIVTFAQSSKTAAYDLNTIAGKIAVLNASGLPIRLSAAVEEEGEEDEDLDILGADGAVLADVADGTTVLPPAVTVNQDTGGAPQNEPAIAIDPNNPDRIVVGANDYVQLSWTCVLATGTPCSGLGDTSLAGYASNDGGATWCCNATSPSNLGSLVPGLTVLTGGNYGVGTDPALAFDSRGHVYMGGIAFNRFTPENTVVVSKGTFDAGGHLSWSTPTLIGATSSLSIFNDKSWIGADAHASSPYRDRVYVTWTRFVFVPGGPLGGAYSQSPIMLAYSADGGRTFTTPKNIGRDVLYSQGSRIVIGEDGTVYVFFQGFLWADYTINGTTGVSIWMTKSTDGGETFSAPVRIAPAPPVRSPANATFRTGGAPFPAAAITSAGDLYVAWTTSLRDTGGLCPRVTNDGCHAAVVYSTSQDGGAHWSAPTLAFPDLDASVRAPVGYPAPDGLTAPAPRRVDTIFPDVAAGPNGSVYIGAYAADMTSPWQTCTTFLFQLGFPLCFDPGPYIHNAKLNFYVINVGAATTTLASTKPINPRYQFRGTFIGDYTGLAVGADGRVHAVWTDTNNAQYITRAGFLSIDPPGVLASQQDIVTRSLP